MANNQRNNSITNPRESKARSIASSAVLQNTEDIDKLYAHILTQEKILEDVKNALQNKRLKDAQEKTKSQILALANFELELQKQGIKVTADLRRQYLEEEAEKQRKADQDALIQRYKLQSDLENASERFKDAQRQKDLNLLDANAKVLNAQRELAKAQKEGKEDEIKKKQQELKEAKKERKEKEKEQKNNKEYIAAQKELSKEKTQDKIAKSWKNQFKELNSQLYDEEGNKRSASDVFKETASDNISKALGNMGKAIAESLNKINNAISTYASYQTEINARLQGVGDFSNSVKILSDVAYSPLIKTEELYANLSSLIAEGIASNVEQKAFLQTVKKGVATTFDVNTQALKNIIRIQQFDSTAARLGMEGYLTRFLNEFVQNTEYLTTTFDSVAESLLQASATMTGQEATQFEFIVQKWLGALTGVGLSETTARNIATAIGQLGSGDISGLSNSQMQNLMVMAASRSGNVNYAEMLTGGLNYNTTNYLMSSVVSYLQELGTYSNNVVKSQLAQTFGVSLSDLMALQNLSASDVQTLLNNTMSYGQMYDELEYQMGQLKSREGIANILENLFSNLTFQTGKNIASNPALYATWKITDLIQSVTGGINIPFITAMGSGFDLNTTVENLIKLGVVGMSTLGNIGDIISGIATGSNGSKMLSALGITATAGSNVTKRGTGLTARSSGVSTSLSTMVGNTEGSDYYESALTSANDDAQSQMADVQSQTEDFTEKTYTMLEEVNFSEKMTNIDKNIGDIYTFLTNEATYMSFSPTLEGLTTYGYDI